MAKILLEEGASPGTGDETGSTPLHLAARAGQKDIALMLLDRGVDVNAGEKLLGWTPLFEAVNNNKPGTALFLLSRGAKPNVRDKRGRTVLADATDLSYDEIANLLRSHGAKK
jgi:ankyrin